jgi:hypothetical protein
MRITSLLSLGLACDYKITVILNYNCHPYIYQEFVIQKGRTMGIDNAEYVKRIEKLKLQLQGEPTTMEALETLDPEMADAYKVFLSRTNVKNGHGMEAIDEVLTRIYSKLSKFLVAKKYTTQITKDIKIGDKVIKTSDLVECLEKSRNALLAGGNIHSEIVSINPRVKGLIAKVEKLEDCPTEFLKFAKEHNLPIILMKSSKE